MDCKCISEMSSKYIKCIKDVDERHQKNFELNNNIHSININYNICNEYVKKCIEKCIKNKK